MDTQQFLDSIGDVFDGDPEEGRPRDARFSDLIEDVAGFTTPAELALLNLAVSLLPEGEAYLEVGTFKGRSACAVLLGQPGRRIVAVENFMEFGMLSADSRAELLANLGRYAADAADFRLLEGDCFRLLAAPDPVGQPVGVYFYDGAHTGLAHHLALAVAEPLLADEALVVIDDASWRMVARATRRFIEDRPGWSVLRVFAAAQNDDPRWANGVALLRFRRPAPDQARRLARPDELRRRFQVSVRGPSARLVWRTLPRVPVLIPLARRLLPKRSRSVDPGG